MLSLLVLGTGGAVPTPSRASAGHWLEVDGRGVLVDPGPGAVSRLLAHPDGPRDVAAITTVVVTHFHPDHCHDLAVLLFARHSPLLREAPPLQLIGPPGLRRYLDALADLYGDWMVPSGAPLRVDEVSPGDSLAPGDDGTWHPSPQAPGPRLDLHAARHTEHRFSGENLCLRCRDAEGTVLSYSGDSEPCPGLVEAAREADLLVVECSTPDAWSLEGHMSPSRVGALCREARPRRVALLHLYPAAAILDLPALVREHFDGPVVTLADGDRLTVTPAGVTRDPITDEKS